MARLCHVPKKPVGQAPESNQTPPLQEPVAITWTSDPLLSAHNVMSVLLPYTQVPSWRETR